MDQDVFTVFLLRMSQHFIITIFSIPHHQLGATRTGALQMRGCSPLFAAVSTVILGNLSPTHYQGCRCLHSRRAIFTHIHLNGSDPLILPGNLVDWSRILLQHPHHTGQWNHQHPCSRLNAFPPFPPPFQQLWLRYQSRYYKYWDH